MEAAHSLVRKFALQAQARQGRVLLVGGSVRDEIMGYDPKDLDVEIYGVKEADLYSMLKETADHVVNVGESFPIWKAWSKGMSANQAIDVSLPRRNERVRDNHYIITFDPDMPYAEAALYRDYTMNSVAKDPLTGELLDPHGGIKDIRDRVLRHTSEHFARDPIRVMRGVQFCARFGLTATPETIELCGGLTMDGCPPERVLGEWSKFILKGRQPSKGLDFLRQTGWVKHFPELNALIGVQQDPEWHPEGDVWTHTKHCLDAFAQRHTGDEVKDLRVGMAVLTHDFGKATHTKWEKGRWSSHGHEEAGVAPATAFLSRMTNQTELIQGVCALVATHMIPHSLRVAAEKKTKPHAMDGAVRRLALRLGKEGTGLDELCIVSTCDNAGRPPLPCLPRAANWLRERAEIVGVVREKPKPLLQGRELIALGHKPGPAFKGLLTVIFERQLDGDVQSVEEATALAQDILAGNPIAGEPLETITLFRASLKTVPPRAPHWSDGDPMVENSRAAANRWFSDSREEAEWYLKNEYFDNGQIVAVTLPKARAEFFRVSNMTQKPGAKSTADNPVAFSRRPEKEFYVPVEVAALARPVVDPEPAPLSAREQLQPPCVEPAKDNPLADLDEIG